MEKLRDFPSHVAVSQTTAESFIVKFLKIVGLFYQRCSGDRQENKLYIAEV